jgi:Nuclease-related domain
MIKKPRQVPKELLMARSLNGRMDLLEDEKWKIEKGFVGEIKFDSLTDELLHNKCWIINGLWLKSGDSTFQIDKVLIFLKKIYLIDVKNFEGDYHFDSEGHFKKADKFLKDPVNQLQRAEDLFRQLLQQYGFHFDIQSYLVYINPEFTLYNAPQNEFVILPTQINRFLKKLNYEYSKINDAQEKLADLLVSLDLVDSPYATYPPYSFEGLRKGIMSSSCHRLLTTVKGDKVVCDDCGEEEVLDAAVLRSVRELMMLFPGMKITSNLVYEWCGGVVSKRTIRRILKKNFQLIRKSKYSYYVEF